MSFSHWVYIAIDEILRETDRAFLVSIDGDEVWLPRSQIADADDYEVGDQDVTLGITEFIAREKGLEAD